MKKIIAIILVFALVLPMCLINADDSSWESDQYGDTTDDMAKAPYMFITWEYENRHPDPDSCRYNRTVFHWQRG